MISSQNHATDDVRLRFVSRPVWKLPSFTGSIFAVALLWMLNLAVWLGLVAISYGLTRQIIHITILIATVVLTVIVIVFGVKMFREEEIDILEITDVDMTFKVVKSNRRQTLSVSIPFRDMAFVEHLTPSPEESPLVHSALVLHDTTNHKITVPIWTMTSNVSAILEFLRARNVRVVTF